MAKSRAVSTPRENAVIRYLRETWFELKKVSWPTRSEAINLTIVVVVVTTFLAIILGLLDYFFAFGFGRLFQF